MISNCFSCSSNYFGDRSKKCVRANALAIPSFYPTCFEWTISTLNYSMMRMKCSSSQASKMSEKYAKVDPYDAMMVQHCEKSVYRWFFNSIHRGFVIGPPVNETVSLSGQNDPITRPPYSLLCQNRPTTRPQCIQTLAKESL